MRETVTQSLILLVYLCATIFSGTPESGQIQRCICNLRFSYFLIKNTLISKFFRFLILFSTTRHCTRTGSTCIQSQFTTKWRVCSCLMAFSCNITLLWCGQAGSPPPVDSSPQYRLEGVFLVTPQFRLEVVFLVTRAAILTHKQLITQGRYYCKTPYPPKLRFSTPF